MNDESAGLVIESEDRGGPEPRGASLWWLIMGSAALMSVTFRMPAWTGIKASREWPIAAAVLLMIVWSIFKRREGLRVATLAASAFGIGAGLLIAKADRWVELGQQPRPVSVAASIFMIGGCAWLYFRAITNERRQKAQMEAIDRDFEAILAMPPEERAAAVEKELTRLNTHMDSLLARTRRTLRWTGLLIGIGMLLTALTFPLAFKPEPKPFHILLNIATLVLGIGYFVFTYGLSRDLRKDDGDGG